MIKTIAACVSASIRSFDRAFRYGSDEFVVILAAKAGSADAAMARLESTIAAEDGSSKLAYPLEFSLGANSLAEEPTADSDRLLHLADQRMYERKRLKKAAQA